MKTTYELEKQRLVDHLKASGQFSDFDYSGSNITALLNTLGSNSANISYLVSMLNNESVPMTAQLIDSLILHAAKQGHLVRRTIAATAVVKINVRTDTEVSNVVAYKGTAFVGTNQSGDTVQFTAPSDTPLKKIDSLNHEGTLIIKQGSYVETSVNFNSLTPQVRVNSLYCDIDTLTVSVSDANSSYFVNHAVYDSTYKPEPTAPIVYVRLGTDYYYTLSFGNNKFGRMPVENSIVKYKYLKCNGDAGNKVGKFKFIDYFVPTIANDARNFEITTTTLSNSTSGASDIDVELLKNTLTYYNRKSGIALTENDVIEKISSVYADIDSISAAGGENSVDYGNITVSIKPTTADRLSVGDKIYIKNTLETRYRLNGDTIVFKDPEFIDLMLSVEYTPSTTNTLTTKQNNINYITKKISEYNKDVLGKFNSVYSDNNVLTVLNAGIKQYDDIYVNKSVAYDMNIVKGVNSYSYKLDIRVGDFVTEQFMIGEIGGYYFKSYEGIVSMYIGKNVVSQNVGTIDYTTCSVNITYSFANTPNEFLKFIFSTQRSAISSKSFIVRIKEVTVK